MENMYYVIKKNDGHKTIMVAQRKATIIKQTHELFYTKKYSKDVDDQVIVSETEKALGVKLVVVVNRVNETWALKQKRERAETTKATKEAMRQSIANGHKTISEIVADVGISKTTAYKYAQKLGYMVMSGKLIKK